MTPAEHSTTAPPAALVRSPAGEALIVSTLMIACLLVLHSGIIFSAFSRTQGGGDSVLNNLILEHEWRWASGVRGDQHLWSPPDFFPQQDTAGYTDLLLGASLPYGAARLLGADPQSAFQAWLLAISALNVLAAYLMLRLLMRCSVVAACAGTALFALGSPRIAQLGHPQLLPGFFVLALFAGIYVLLASPPEELTRRRLAGGLVLAAGGAVAQVYTAFYDAWFSAFLAALALPFVLVSSRARHRSAAFFRRRGPEALAAAAAAVLLALPVARLYADVLKQVGPRTYAEVQAFLPTALSWIAQGPHHWIYGGLNERLGIGADYGGQEMFNGLGLVTTVLVLAGFVLGRRRPAVALLGCASAAAVVLSLRWPGGFSLWRFVYDRFPAAQAIRAVSRVGVFLLLPFSVAAAVSVDWIKTRISPVVAVLCLVLVVVEQSGTLGGVPTYPRATVQGPAEDIVRHLRPACQTFLVSFTRGQTSLPFVHLFGMWAEVLSNVPTLNGYSGLAPPDWPLWDVTIAGPADRVRIADAIRTWEREYPREIRNVCWVVPGEPAAVLIENPAAGTPAR